MTDETRDALILALARYALMRHPPNEQEIRNLLARADRETARPEAAR